MRYPREQMTEYMRQYRRRRKEWALARLGGKCRVCGTTESLEFDHIDPGTKTLAIGKMWHAGKAAFEAEIDKCQLLCTTHHLAKSRSEGSLGSGARRPPTMYHFECKCCGAATSRPLYRLRYALAQGRDNLLCSRGCATRWRTIQGGASRQTAPAAV